MEKGYGSKTAPELIGKCKTEPIDDAKFRWFVFEEANELRDLCAIGFLAIAN